MKGVRACVFDASFRKKNNDLFLTFVRWSMIQGGRSESYKLTITDQQTLTYVAPMHLIWRRMDRGHLRVVPD